MSSTAEVMVQTAGCCICCSNEKNDKRRCDREEIDGAVEESQNGFSNKAAKKYSRGVAVSAKFGLEDNLINHHIKVYLEENEDIQNLWIKMAEALKASHGGAAPVNEEKREYFDVVED